MKYTDYPLNKEYVPQAYYTYFYYLLVLIKTDVIEDLGDFRKVLNNYSKKAFEEERDICLNRS